MRRVLLVATTTGYQIRSFGEAAEKLGVRLVFASDRCDRLKDPWWDGAIPVRFHDEASSVDAVLSACRGAPPDGILAVGDRPAVLAAHLARALGLPGHPPEAATVSRNKLATRRALKAAGLPTPWFEGVSIDRDVFDLNGDVPYPAVVKPLALSGSRGVMRVNNSTELAAAFERLRSLLRAPDVRRERDPAFGQAIVESFIPGAEYAVEGVLDHGTLRPLAIFDKPDPLDGPFFEETIYVTPSLVSFDLQQRIVEAVAAASRAIGLHHGPVHAECRVDVSGLGAAPAAQMPVHVLEVAARPIGGLCSRALRLVDTREGSGERQEIVSLEEALLRHALGEDITAYTRETQASGVMMIPIPRRGIYRRVNGLDEARTVAGIEDIRVTAKPDTVLVPLPEGKSYLGFIFARAEKPQDVERALRTAHARLGFVIDREMAVVGS